MNPRSTTIFVHIPKAAGFTLKHLLESYYGLGQSFLDVHLFDDRIDYLSAPSSDVAFLEGHQAYGLHKSLVGDYRYITVLREPYDRVISHFKHILRHPDHTFHRVLTDQGFEAAMDDTNGIELRNVQTRLIAGRPHVWSKYLDRAALEAAKRNLDEVFTFGLVEDFEQTLELVRRDLGIGLPAFENLNIAPRDQRLPEITEAVRQRICSENAFDLELYEYASVTCRRRVAHEIAVAEAVTQTSDSVELSAVVNDVPWGDELEVVLNHGKINVLGWTYDTRAARPASAVLAELDGHKRLALTGLHRRDVAERRRLRNALFSGFRVSFPAPAEHREATLRLRAVSTDSRTFAEKRCTLSWASDEG